MTQYSDQSRYYHHTFHGKKVVVCNNDDTLVVELPVRKNSGIRTSFDDLKRCVGENITLPSSSLIA